MDVFTMVVIIVAISCLAGVLNNFLKTKRATLRQGPGDEAMAEIEALKERVAVLEEIVTDDRYRLDRELNRLG
ncbi:MAG: hypothetical protein RIC56_23165 [Pseudomonadales bacterium]